MAFILLLYYTFILQYYCRLKTDCRHGNPLCIIPTGAFTVKGLANAARAPNGTPIPPGCPRTPYVARTYTERHTCVHRTPYACTPNAVRARQSDKRQRNVPGGRMLSTWRTFCPGMTARLHIPGRHPSRLRCSNLPGDQTAA